MNVLKAILTSVVVLIIGGMGNQVVSLKESLRISEYNNSVNMYEIEVKRPRAGILRKIK